MHAIGELYDRHHTAIFRYVWSRVYHTQTAEDLTGEIFARMVDNLPHYRSRSVAFRAWLYRIAHNLVVDHYRQQGSYELAPLYQAEILPGESDNPAAAVERQLSLERMYHALERLDPAQREVLTLRFLAGLPLCEVAQALDKSIPAVKSLQHRGLAALRAWLHEE